MLLFMNFDLFMTFCKFIMGPKENFEYYFHKFVKLEFRAALGKRDYLGTGLLSEALLFYLICSFFYYIKFWLKNLKTEIKHAKNSSAKRPF